MPWSAQGTPQGSTFGAAALDCALLSVAGMAGLSVALLEAQEAASVERQLAWSAAEAAARHITAAESGASASGCGEAMAAEPPPPPPLEVTAAQAKLVYERRLEIYTIEGLEGRLRGMQAETGSAAAVTVLHAAGSAMAPPHM